MSTLTIIDSVTSAPIPGAKVYVIYSNGTTQTLTADSFGNVSFALVVASITIKADGYQTGKTTQSQGSVLLYPTVTPGSKIIFYVEPSTDQTSVTSAAPSSGAQITVQDNQGNFLESLAVGPQGSVLSQASYPPGQYLVSIAQPGFNPISNQVLTITSGQTDAVFALSQTQTGSLAETPDALSDTGTIQINTKTSVAQDDPYEYVYPNSVDGKYFQAAQARMYIGKYFVDELVQCQWMLAENKIPIYGYRSSRFDAVGRGHSLVQGQLAINFISEGYMYVLLQEFRKKISSSTRSNPDLSEQLQSQIDDLVSKRSTAAARLQDTSSIDEQLISLGSSSSAAANYINNAVKGTLPGSAGTGIRHRNAVYLDIPFDIEVKLDGAGRTVTRKLTTCFLGANDISIAHDGQTLLDTYSFIARSVS